MNFFSTEQIASQTTMSDDPCDQFICNMDYLPGEICKIPFKGPYDISCYIPCLVSNCSIDIFEADLCPIFICKEIFTTTEQTTTAVPPPSGNNWQLILGLSIGIPGDKI